VRSYARTLEALQETENLWIGSVSLAEQSESLVCFGTDFGDLFVYPFIPLRRRTTRVLSPKMLAELILLHKELNVFR
jgi:hypothetical protein